MKKFISIVMAAILSFGMGTSVFAAADLVVPEEFETIGGVGTIKDREEYYLDIAYPGIMDMSGSEAYNAKANSYFTWQIDAVVTTCTLYYRMASFDFVELFRPYVEPYQKNFKEKLFDGAILFFIALAFLGMAKVALKRNYPEILSRLTQIVVLCVLAALLSNNSLTVISTLHNISDDVSSAIISSMNVKLDSEEYNTSVNNAYALDTVKTLWRTLVHNPWMTLEFDKYVPDSTLVQDLLDGDLPKDSKERQDKIDEINKEEAEKKKTDKNIYIPFQKHLASERMDFIMGFNIILLPKCAIYILIGAAQCVLKIGTIFLVLMGNIIMLLSIVPWFGGMKLLEKWGLEILKMQVTVCLFSFFCGFIVLLDNLSYNAAIKWGWRYALIFQIIMFIGFVLLRKQIFSIFKKLPEKILTKNSADLTRIHAGDVQAALAAAGSGVQDKAVDIGSGIYRTGESAFNKISSIGAGAFDAESTYIEGLSGDSPKSSASQSLDDDKNRPSLDIGHDSLATGEASPSSNTAKETPRPALQKAESGGNKKTNVNNLNNSLSYGSNEEFHNTLEGNSQGSYKKSPSTMPRNSDIDIFVDEDVSSGTSEQPKANQVKGNRASNDIIGYDDLQQRPSLEEPSRSREKRPAKREEAETSNDTNNQIQPQNDRPVAAKEFNFDMGNFEPGEIAVNNETNNTRPVLEDVS